MAMLAHAKEMLEYNRGQVAIQDPTTASYLFAGAASFSNASLF
jgi:hypothetical protein